MANAKQILQATELSGIIQWMRKEDLNKDMQEESRNVKEKQTKSFTWDL